LQVSFAYRLNWIVILDNKFFNFISTLITSQKNKGVDLVSGSRYPTTDSMYVGSPTKVAAGIK
jgi:hypothetical protein